MKGKGRYGQFIRWIFTALDFLVLNFAYFFICWWNGVDHGFYSRTVWLLLNASFLTVTYFFSSIHDRRVVYADRVLLEVVKSVIMHAALFLALISFLETDNLTWRIVIKFYLLFFSLLGMWWIFSRKLLKRYRTKGFNFKRIIVVGRGSSAQRLVKEMESDKGYGYRILGIFDNKVTPSNTPGQIIKGRLDDVETFVKDNLIDEMYCALGENESNAITRMITIAEQNAVDFYYVPQVGRNITRRFELMTLGNVPIMAMRPYPLANPLARMAKRLFDLAISTIALLLSPIVLIPVAIGIKLSSPGPIFFKQTRTGYRGKPFECYKFRTMRVNVDADRLQATKDDPRKTRFGNLLRRTSIDELPQFFNVWRGEMSIVGPRPHMIKHTEAYSVLIEKYMLRHTIKPGITGWAQVNGYRGATDQLWKMERRVEHDVWYAENWNFLLDLKIIYLTIANVFKGEKNAF